MAIRPRQPYNQGSTRIPVLSLVNIMSEFFKSSEYRGTKAPVGRYGALQVLWYAGYFRSGKERVVQHAWLCQCDCGREKIIRGGGLVNNQAKSCGCQKMMACQAACRSHGQTGSRMYCIWQNMKRRCTDSSGKQFKDYGGRGIRVCQRWLTSFQNFSDDMGECPYGMSIDRMDNNGDYTPENCRWSTRKTQNRNKRTTIYLTYSGETLTLADWSERLGIHYKTLKFRYDEGWPIEELLGTPVRRRTRGNQG